MINKKELEEIIECHHLSEENKFSDNILYLKENLLKYENILFKENINDKENLNCQSSHDIDYNHNVTYKNIPEICEKSFLSNEELMYYHHFIQMIIRKIISGQIDLPFKMQVGHLLFQIETGRKNALLCPLCFHNFYEKAIEMINDSIKGYEERIKKDVFIQKQQKLKKNYQKINRRKINSMTLKLYRNINKKKSKR